MEEVRELLNQVKENEKRVRDIRERLLKDDLRDIVILTKIQERVI